MKYPRKRSEGSCAFLQQGYGSPNYSSEKVACHGAHFVDWVIHMPALARQVIVNRSGGRSDALWIATFLPIKRWRHLIPFLVMSWRIEQQVGKTSGVLRYGVRADLFKRRFWTVSVWSSRSASETFVRSEPHATAVHLFNQWAAPDSAFLQWIGPDDNIKWAEIIERLQTAAERNR